MKRISTLIFGLFAILSGYTQTPEKMTYQAVIRDASDVLVSNTTVGMQISILEGSSTGTAVYVETHTPTTNDNGLVSLEVGGGTVVSGDFTTIPWGTDSYFIKSETDPTGGTSYTIEGTSQLLSVPYALFAKNTAALGNTLDQAYDQEGGGGPSTRTILADDGKIEIVATGNKALELTADPAFIGLGITSTGAGSMTIDQSGPGDAVEIEGTGGGDIMNVVQSGLGSGLDIWLSNAASVNDAIAIDYDGTSDGISVDNSTNGVGDGIDVTQSGTGDGIFTVVLGGGSGNAFKALNMGTGNGLYVDNTAGVGAHGVKVDQLGAGHGLEINGAVGNTSDLLEINNLSDERGLFVSNTSVTATGEAVKVVNSSPATGLFLDNAGTGIGLNVFNGNPAGAGETAKFSQTGTGTGVFIENAGSGKGLIISHLDPTNTEEAIFASTVGRETVALLVAEDNDLNTSSTLVAEHKGKGSSGIFITTDNTSAKVNDKPTVNVVSNGLGVGVNIDIVNPELASDANTEPALFARHFGAGQSAHFTKPSSHSTAHIVEIINPTLGNALHIDAFGAPSSSADDALHVEQSNLSGSTTSGYAALFETHAASTFADAVVKISSAIVDSGSSALRVIPADPTKLAAVFEGDVEVASDILIGGTMTAAVKAFKIDHPLDPDGKFLIHNSIESNERINIYSGNITTDDEGFATVVLPDYMSALNTNFKYQLTIVDKSFAQAIIWETFDPETNTFKIRTDAPNITVSWQLTGSRQDKWSLENPLQVEVSKNNGM